MELMIKEPSMAGARVEVEYLVDGTTYKHAFIAPAPLDAKDAITRKLVQWLAVIHSMYLFSFGYITDISTTFYLDDDERKFFETLFDNGLAEFRYVNSIPITTKTTVHGKSDSAAKPTLTHPPKQLHGRLLLNGGGKDGIVSGQLLESSGLDFKLFQVGKGKAQAMTKHLLGVDSIVFTRKMDERWRTGKLSGHRATSAAVAIAATLSAYTLGYKDVVTSNESSANDANIAIDGVLINHQYSKSFQFEVDFSDLLSAHSIPVRYFSILRPLHELQIARMLASTPTNAGQFVSCNHGFRKGYWCMRCAKCAFIALILTAVSPDFASATLGTGALNKPELLPHISALVSDTNAKPFECVGTLEECRLAAMMILGGNYPLSSELRALFNSQTANIDSSDIDRLFASFDVMNRIPRDYNAAMERMQGA